MSNFICLCGLLSKLDQGCNDRTVLAARWLQREIMGSCKVLQLILAQARRLKLKILATVTGNAQQRGSNPGYWFSSETHKTMGETFPIYCKVGQEIFACMSSVSPNIKVWQVQYDTNNRNCELNFQAKLSTELTEIKFVVLNMYLSLHSTLHLRGHLRAMQIQTSILMYHFIIWKYNPIAYHTGISHV